MKLFISALALLVAATPLSSSAQDDLLARAGSVNRNLHSYTAKMKAHVVLTTFPFLTADLEGTYYHKDPDRDKLEITNGLPALAQQFGKLYPHIVPPSNWGEVYSVQKLSDDGEVTRYKLVPKEQGNVQDVEAAIDDKRATVTSMTWNYANGGSAQMNNTYSSVKGYLVVTSQNGRVDEPQYKGTITSSMSGYQMNPNLADSVFTQSQ